MVDPLHQVTRPQLFKCMKGLFSKETVALCQGLSETQKFGIKQADRGQISIEKDYKADVSDISHLSEPIHNLTAFALVKGSSPKHWFCNHFKVIVEI